MVPVDVLTNTEVTSKATAAAPVDPALQKHLRQVAHYLKDKFHSWQIDNRMSSL